MFTLFYCLLDLSCGECNDIGLYCMWINNKKNNVYLKSNIQTRSMECTYKLIKDNKYHTNVQVKYIK